MYERTTKKVVIDAGHGGDDPGTSANNIIEKEYTLMISNYIKNRLDELGIESSLSRSTDETLDSTTRPDRIQSFYGDGEDVLVVSNHLNSGGGDGAEIIYALRNDDTFASKIATEFENAGQNVRKYYQRRLPSNPAKDYYYVLRDTANNESVIVEYGFVDSTGDDVSQIINDWESLAEAVTKAITEYAGGTYIAPTNSNYHTVVSGDTLWSIAKTYGLTVDELKELNNLSSNLISIGQNLLISDSTEQTTNTYTVKSGDTLYSIAKTYNTTVDNLVSLNNLSTTTLSIGQVLTLPKDETLDSTTYTVKSGDTLYSIANSYGLTVDELKTANNLSTNLLSIGQTLTIPSSTSTKTYTVKSGDTLYSIAQTYNTTVSALKELNNLSSNILSIGQILIIPTSTYTTYTVKSGDTLYSIAQTYGTTVSTITNLNNLSSTTLSIGQQLLLPI